MKNIFQKLSSHKDLIKNTLLLLSIFIIICFVIKFEQNKREIISLQKENFELRDFYYMNVNMPKGTDFEINSDYNKRQNNFCNLKVKDEVEKEYYQELKLNNRDAELLFISNNKENYLVCFTKFASDAPCQYVNYNLKDDKYIDLDIYLPRFSIMEQNAASPDKKYYSIIVDDVLKIYEGNNMQVVLQNKLEKGYVYGEISDFGGGVFPDFKWVSNNKAEVGIYKIENNSQRVKTEIIEIK